MDYGSDNPFINNTIVFQVLLTTRNVLIANLAITDLILSTVSMPLYLVDITLKYWPLGVNMVILIIYNPPKKSIPKG